MLVLPEAPFAAKDTGYSLPVVLSLCSAAFSQIYANRSKNEAFGKVQEELGKAEVRRSQLGGNPAAPVL